MKIAFIGHVFHERTGSSIFAREILKEFGEVTVMGSSPDEPSGHQEDAIVEAYASRTFDLWVFWQTEYVAARLIALGLRNAVLAPMYDAVYAMPDSYFQQFALSRFLTFSRDLHSRLQALSLRSASFEFWPEPEPVVERSTERDDWSAFFWERRPFTPPHAPSVIAQCRALGIPRLHVHCAPDFRSELRPTGTLERLGRLEGVEVTTSQWFPDKAAFREVARKPQFVFAPRLHEGIGMATLEAMAAGQVVIAPDRPTANQYIGHMSSGILYDPARPEALPVITPDHVAALSAAARARVVAGRQEWEADADRFRSFLLDDGRRWSSSDSSAAFANDLRRRARERRLRSVAK